MGRVCVFTRKCPAPAWALARDLPALIHWQRGVSVAVPATATNTPTHTTISTSHALTASHITRAHAFSRTRHSHRVHATPSRLHHYVCTSIAWAPLNSPIHTIDTLGSSGARSERFATVVDAYHGAEWLQQLVHKRERMLVRDHARRRQLCDARWLPCAVSLHSLVAKLTVYDALMHPCPVSVFLLPIITTLTRSAHG
jgi:hypothetical protein